MSGAHKIHQDWVNVLDAISDKPTIVEKFAIVGVISESGQSMAYLGRRLKQGISSDVDEGQIRDWHNQSTEIYTRACKMYADLVYSESDE